VARPAALRDIVAEGIFDALVLRTTADGGGEMPDELPVDLAECGNLAGARRGVPVSRREGRTAEERTLERNVGIIYAEGIAERLVVGRKQAYFLREQPGLERADL